MAQGDIPTRDDLDRMGKDDLLRLARQFGLDVVDDMTITALRVSLWVHRQLETIVQERPEPRGVARHR